MVMPLHSITRKLTLRRLDNRDALADDSSKEWIWVKVQQHDLEDLGLMAEPYLPGLVLGGLSDELGFSRQT